MIIKSIVAAAAIALIAGVGSVSADELSVAEITGDTGTPFAMLNGIATEQMSVQEMATTRGAGVDWRFSYSDERLISDSSDVAGTYFLPAVNIADFD